MIERLIGFRGVGIRVNDFWGFINKEATKERALIATLSRRRSRSPKDHASTERLLDGVFAAQDARIAQSSAIEVAGENRHLFFTIRSDVHRDFDVEGEGLVSRPAPAPFSRNVRGYFSRDQVITAARRDLARVRAGTICEVLGFQRGDTQRRKEILTTVDLEHCHA